HRAALRAAREAAGGGTAPVDGELPRVPACGVLPAVEPLPPARAAVAAVGRRRDAPIAVVAVRRARRVPARAVVVDLQHVRPREYVLADPVRPERFPQGATLSPRVVPAG